MSYPVLYNSTEKTFDHNGIGVLSSCTFCEVTEEENGAFELELQYPVDGIHFSEIGLRSIIKAKLEAHRPAQLFRVCSISKPMSGVVSVSAEHISYDLSGFPVRPLYANSASGAFAEIKKKSVFPDFPFSFETDNDKTGSFFVNTPTSIRSLLGGSEGSIIDVFGGEYEFDNFVVKLHKKRGEDRGVSIRYGKNLTDINQEKNCNSVYTGVYPFWYSLNDDGSETLVELDGEKIVSAPGEYDFTKIKVLDLSDTFNDPPTSDDLLEVTRKHIKDNNIGVPSVSLSVSYLPIEQSEEYKYLSLFERVGLCDTVNVVFPAFGVSATSKVVKVVYDVIRERVKSITLGSVRPNIADTICNIIKKL